MKIFLGAAFIALIISCTHAEYAPELDFTIAKKDLFMSRGWGASGMPYPMFYLNRYTQTQQIQQHKQHDSPKILNPSKDYTVAEYLGKPGQSPYEKDVITHRKTNQSRRNHTVPHLFVSYAWGPLG